MGGNQQGVNHNIVTNNQKHEGDYLMISEQEKNLPGFNFFYF